MTAFGAVESAVQAMRAGATNYLTKPLNSDELLLVIERALEDASLRRETRELRDKLNERYDFSNIVGQSAEMQSRVQGRRTSRSEPRDRAREWRRLAPGKELIASALHHNSDRRERPFVKLHCAALAETLLESELFDRARRLHGSGPSTDWSFRKPADGGTLFLDEIGEISAATPGQAAARLARAEFERVGGNQTVRVDVRVVAATNRDLKKLVLAGKFREPLLSPERHQSHSAALRERPDDIVALARALPAQVCVRERQAVCASIRQAVRILRAPLLAGECANWRTSSSARSCWSTALAGLAAPSALRMPTNRAPTMAVCPHAYRRQPGPISSGTRHLADPRARGGSTTQAAQMLGISVRKVQYRLRDYAEAPKPAGP